MKGIATCEDCEVKVTVYRFTGSQGFFRVPKKWCEECDLLVYLVEKTVKELGIESKTKITVKPWFLWWWQALLTHFAWHAPILIINGKLISHGIVPSKQNLIKALTKMSFKQQNLPEYESILSLIFKRKDENYEK